jgi:hypothetical protein
MLPSAWCLAALMPLASCTQPARYHGVVGVAVLKQPRVGSTWVKKEFNMLPNVHLCARASHASRLRRQ